jgi:selenocysteine lyase/cysteine desulfurase
MLTTGTERALFDIPPGEAYFNIAYYAPQLNATRERLVQAAGIKSRPWERTAPDFFSDAERIRELAARLFGGDGDAWAIGPSASYGLSTAARILEPTLAAGDRIVVLHEQFPSNVLPWRRVARETGATIATVPPPADGDWTRAALDAIAPDVRVVALPHCRWTDGARLDLAAIGQACRAAGAALVLDVTQSLGAMTLDLDAVQPDFMVAAGYKWLLCPYGFALMYVAPRWRDARPLEESWMGRVNAEDFAGLVNYSDEYRPGARRFDVGQNASAILPGVVAAFEQLERWTVEAIERALADLNGRLQTRLQSLGFVLPSERQRSPHLFGAQLPARVSGNLVAALRARRVYVSQRGSSLRVAPHLHVTEADVQQLFGALDEVLGSAVSSVE